jgi:hypothetical protein
MTNTEQLADHLTSLGLIIRERIMVGRDTAADSRAMGVAAGDTIFAIDRKVEPLILSAMVKLPADLLPVLVVCEGLGKDGRQRFGPADQPLKFQVLIDPIDGTRSLMYDKRSAWFLAAAAPDRGGVTSLGDAVVSVMVELPTSKQGLADNFVSIDSVAKGERRNLLGGNAKSLTSRPSTETSLRHGFGQVASFFPGVKVLAASLMEAIAAATLGAVSVKEASIFDDQYICTGGQLVELMTGRDRFCCDLRPIFYDILRREGSSAESGLCCHPYDMAGLPIAKALGVVLTDGYGNELDAKFDVESPVHWCGYANQELRNSIEPVIQGWLRERLGST